MTGLIPPKYDGAVTIATGGSRWAKTWKNVTMNWSDLLSRLETTTRTQETADEYRKLSKAQQDTIKDTGGYVGGWLKQGRRKADSLQHRSLITLDADFAESTGLLDDFSLLYGAAGALYSTHKHTPSAPRLRLIVPLSRTVTGDEYQAAARKLAESLGIDQFDDSTYQPTRLMYWPSTPRDGDYVFAVADGPWLDPDELLGQYPDWRDTSFWPESSRCAGVRKKTADKQGDPQTKPGIVGAFCRVYDVEAAIAAFLADTYAPCTTPGRYTYTKGSTSSGLVIYDDGQFAYSNHATDPASGRLCNAFDLVRIHKFGDLDEDTPTDTPINRRPSYTAMTDFARKDERVIAQTARERLQSAREDFALDPDPEDWMDELIQAGLTVDKRGRPEQTINNVFLILTHDPSLKGAIAFNAFKERPVSIRRLPWRDVTDPVNGDVWSDDDDSQLRRYIELGYAITGRERVADAVASAAHANVIHPIRDYLEGLEWDGEPRLERLLVDYLSAEDTPYTHAVTRKTFTAAVARIFDPGCKYDYILVLSGPQGRGKSSLVAKMSRGWYTDSLAGIGTKEAYEGLQGYWLVELGELAAMRKAEIETIKNFISKQVDSYRAAYGRRVQDHPRQCIFIGTTNSTAFLRDDTGNRRFWPVRLQDAPPRHTVWGDLTPAVIDQLWAEAVALYRSGEPLTLAPDMAATALAQQEQFTESDPRQGLVEDYLDVLLPADWASWSRDSRQLWFIESDAVRVRGTVQRRYVSAVEVWTECLGNSPEKFPRQDKREISAILRQLPGWKEEPERQRCGPYGKQTRFCRV